MRPSLFSHHVPKLRMEPVVLRVAARHHGRAAIEKTDSLVAALVVARLPVPGQCVSTLCRGRPELRSGAHPYTVCRRSLTRSSVTPTSIPCQPQHLAHEFETGRELRLQPRRRPSRRAR